MTVEIRRQIAHAVLGTIVLVILITFGIQFSLLLSGLVFFIFLVGSMLIRLGLKISIIEFILSKFQRNYEKNIPLFGVLTFFLGMTLLLFFFPRMEIVLGALIVGVYGDAASALVGKTIGKHRYIKYYSVEGTLGGIIVSFALLSIIFSWVIALIAAVIGMIAELLPIDDNISIPIVTAIVLTLLL